MSNTLSISSVKPNKNLFIKKEISNFRGRDASRVSPPSKSAPATYKHFCIKHITLQFSLNCPPMLK